MEWNMQYRPSVLSNIAHSSDEVFEEDDSFYENSSSDSESEDSNSKDGSLSDEDSATSQSSNKNDEIPEIDLAESIPGTPEGDKVEEKQISYFDMYISVNEKGEYSLHIKKVIDEHDAMCKNDDVYFPLEQTEEVEECLKELMDTEVDLDPEIRKKFLKPGITTSHVEMWLEFSPDFDAYAIFFLSIQNGAEVSFPKDEAAMWCLNRLEWYRTKGRAEYSNFYL